MQALLAMVTVRPSWIDVALKLGGVVALFGGLAATIMLLLSSGPTISVDAVATAIARADDDLQRGGRVHLP